MGLLHSIKETFLSKQVFGFNASKDDKGTETFTDKLPVQPNWFFSPVMGQPRGVDLAEIRRFAKSPWVQMVLNTIKKEVNIIPYEIVPCDEEDETDYSEQIKKVEDDLDQVNSDRETITDLANMIITDVGEIDSGVWVNVYTTSSYEEKEIPVYDNLGRVAGSEKKLVLKPLGQRELVETRIADSATFLKKIDIYRRIQGYYQYSWKAPRARPIEFEPDEVVYFQMNKRPESVYGFSPVEAIQQVLEVLLQSTRYNKEFFKSNAMPDGIIGLPNADPESLKMFKDMWNSEFKGKAHKLLFHNTDAKFAPFAPTQRDMEWLEGQKWYFHLVFGVFGVSPTEAGFHENVNQGNQAGQERVTVRNAIKPYLKLIENRINKRIITELLQEERPKIKFKFCPTDHAEEQIQFDQYMKEIEVGTMTVNEYRKLKGKDPVEWGDDQKNKPQDNPFLNPDDKNPLPFNANQDAEDKRKEEENQSKKTFFFKQAFERFLDDSEQKSDS